MKLKMNIKKHEVAMIRVLKAINQYIPYHRSMNFIVANLLVTNNGNEENAYWTFMGLCYSQSYQLIHNFESGTTGLNLRLFQLTKLIKIHMPELYDHFLAFNLHPNIFATDWLSNLFMDLNTLPYPVAIEIFDWFLFDGWKAIFRVALALLSMLETEDDSLYGFAFGEIINRLSGLRDDPKVQNSSRLKQIAMKFKVTRKLLNEYEKEYTLSQLNNDECEPLLKTKSQILLKNSSSKNNNNSLSFEDKKKEINNSKRKSLLEIHSICTQS